MRFCGGLCPVVAPKCLKKWRISAVVGFWLKRYVNICDYYIVFTVIYCIFLLVFTIGRNLRVFLLENTVDFMFI